MADLGVVAELEAAVDNGLRREQATQRMDQSTAVAAGQLAVDAVSEAIAQSADQGNE